MPSLIFLAIGAGVLLVLLVGTLVLMESAFFHARPQTQQQVTLPLLQGDDLRTWGAEQGRRLTAECLAQNSMKLGGYELVRQAHNLLNNVLSSTLPGLPPLHRSALNCSAEHPPQVSVPEALLIAAELSAIAPRACQEIQHHGPETPATWSVTGRSCPLAAWVGFCNCSHAQPLDCIVRCRAGLETPAHDVEWAETLKRGLLQGIREQLTLAGLDGESYPLPEALHAVLRTPDALHRWETGMHLCDALSHT